MTGGWFNTEKRESIASVLTDSYHVIIGNSKINSVYKEKT